MNQNQENQNQNEKKVFQRNCENPKNNPDCYKIITYKTKCDCLVGLKSNSKCKACARYRENNGLSSNQRLCPNSKNNSACEKIIIFGNSFAKNKADLKNLECHSCRKCEVRDQNDLNLNQRYCPNAENNPRCQHIISHANSIQRKNAEIQNRPCASCAWIKRHRKNKNYNLEKLLLDELDSFYWMGFLLADGGFSLNGGMGLDIAYRDYNHLLKFAEFISYKNKIYVRSGKSRCSDKILHACSISVGDKFVVDKLINKFGIIPPKTYNPPNIAVFNNFSEDQIKALIIGFIDGDGCIYGESKAALKVECHISWEPVLKFFMKYIGESSKFGISCRNLAGIHNRNFSELCELKRFILENNLPCLERKWNKVDFSYKTKKMKWDEKYLIFKNLIEIGESHVNILNALKLNTLASLDRRYKLETNYKTRHDVFREKYAKFIELFLLGKRNGEISNELGISTSAVSTYKKKFLNGNK